MPLISICASFNNISFLKIDLKDKSTRGEAAMSKKNFRHESKLKTKAGNKDFHVLAFAPYHLELLEKRQVNTERKLPSATKLSPWLEIEPQTRRLGATHPRICAISI